MAFVMSSFIDVEVDPDNQWFGMVGSCLITLLTHSLVHFFPYDSSALIPNSIHELDSYALSENSSLTIVAFESPSIVVKFADSVFYGCSSLESICIPSSVRFIGKECFCYCESLVSVTFEQPSAVEIIDAAAFRSCESLPHISIPASIQQIGNRCFLDCDALTSITFESPSNLSILWELGALNLRSIEIPDSVEVMRGMTDSSTARSLVVSFGCKSKLSTVYPQGYDIWGIGAFVRYSEATLRKFRATVDDSL
jgi:hypothetical protein